MSTQNETVPARGHQRLVRRAAICKTCSFAGCLSTAHEYGCVKTMNRVAHNFSCSRYEERSRLLILNDDLLRHFGERIHAKRANAEVSDRAGDGARS